MWVRLVVLSQRVLAEIVFEVTPQSMRMIGSVLSIVVLENEGRTLDPKIVWLAGLDLTCPRKADLLKSCLLDLVTIGTGDLVAESIEVLIQ